MKTGRSVPARWQSDESAVGALPAGSPRCRLLVLEDEFLIALDLKAAIEEFGCVCVGPACTEEQALQALDETSFDAALLDINLGSGTSFAVATALQDRNVPFAFISGYDAACLPAAFADVALLKKPFGRKDLKQLVRQLSLAAEP